jgi:hypothetical protein
MRPATAVQMKSSKDEESHSALTVTGGVVQPDHTWHRTFRLLLGTTFVNCIISQSRVRSSPGMVRRTKRCRSTQRVECCRKIVGTVPLAESS